MDCTHIYLQLLSDESAQFALFDDNGTKVYEGSCALKMRSDRALSQYGKLDPYIAEQVLRVITREHMDHDVGASTPIFARYA